MEKRTIFFLLACLSLIVITTASGQTYSKQPYYFQIIVTDQTETDTITIGLHPLATYGVDGKIGFGIGDTVEEIALPPPPPTGPLDVRIVDHYSTRGGDDLQIDIRDWIGDLQTDTFVISFRSSSNPGSEKMTFTWSDNISQLGWGGFKLVPYSLPLDSPKSAIDMTSQTSYTYPIWNDTVSQTFYIITGDGYKFRAFHMDSLALAHDSKGKYKIEKLKYGTCKFWMRFTNNTGSTVEGLNVKFGANIIEFLDTYTISPVVSLPSKGTFHFVTGAIAHGGSFVVAGIGDKGKAMTAKGTWTDASSIVIGTKFNGVADSTKLKYKNPPNLFNMLQELYDDGYFGSTGLTIGIPAPSNRYMFFPKYTDAIKTLNNKGTTHSVNAYCLDSLPHGSKAKAFKTGGVKKYDPKKNQNKLLAALMTLKFNIAASNENKTPLGYGQLLLRMPGTDFDGITLDSLSKIGDYYMTNCAMPPSSASPSPLRIVAATALQLAAALDGVVDSDTQDVNGGFNVCDDEEDINCPIGSGTTAQGTVSVNMVDYFLYRVSDSMAVFTMPTNHALYQLQRTPEKFELMQNYPNPFNPTTTIGFNLPADGFVTIKIYNILGQEVRALADHEEFTEGENEIDFDATNLASGVYVYRLVVHDSPYRAIKKMVLLK